MTEVRRTLKVVADHFFPPKSDPYVCADGNIRKMGEDQYLNRLGEYLSDVIPTSTAKDLAKAELNVLGTFVHRLNELASKGVHSEVKMSEARQGYVGMYMFLATISQYIPKV